MELESLLRGPGIRNVQIDAEAGEFELSFVNDVASPFNFPLRFHPSEFPAEDIRDPEIRASTAENVELVWRLMREDFCYAVSAKRCAVFGRAIKLSNPLTLVAPDVFNQMVSIDWLNRKAQAESGETFYSLYVAPPHAAYGYTAAIQDKVSEPIQPKRRVRSVSKEHEAAQEAFEALKRQGVSVDDLSNMRLIERIGLELKRSNRAVPSNETILRATGRRPKGNKGK
jgi:hypothetical protein